MKETCIFLCDGVERPAGAQRHDSKRPLIWIAAFVLSASLLSADPPQYQPSQAEPLSAPAPKVNGKISIQYSGVTQFSEAQLRTAIGDQITEINQSGLTPANADDAAFFLGVFYRRHGYAQADVRSEIKAGSTLLLTVSEGPLTAVGNLTISGNRYASVKDLSGYILGPTQERFPRQKGALPYIEEDIKTGIDQVRGLYASEGFLNAVVDPPVTHFAPDNRSVDIHVTISEGMQYHFGKVTFAGDLVYFSRTGTSAQQKSLNDRIKPFLAKPYTQNGVTNMMRAVVYFYRTRGYYNVKVASDAHPESAPDGIVPVTFTVDSGALFRFGAVKAQGLDRLRPDFLPRRFQKLQGQTYDPAKSDAIFQELMRTGLFRQLKIEPHPLPNDELELDMKVEEAKARELGFGIGYGTFEGFILGLTAGDQDLFGNGRPLTGTAEFSERYLKGQILYEDPWFAESDYKLDLRLTALTETFDGYSKLEVGLRAELSRQLAKHLQATLFLQPREEKITSTGIPASDIGTPSYFVNSIGASFTLDYRDSIINPRKGFIVNGAVDIASSYLGSSIDYARGTFRASYYVPIGRTLLAFGARGGIIASLGGGEIPIDERFFNGGSRSVRSFVERGLGPHDLGFPIGGQTFTTFNTEYVFPLIGQLEGAVFVDAGSVGQHSNGAGQMRYAVGAGLRYALPIGPLRIDYGINPDPKNSEAIGALNIGFGIAF